MTLNFTKPERSNEQLTTLAASGVRIIAQAARAEKRQRTHDELKKLVRAL
jgi:hypothetical protein